MVNSIPSSVNSFLILTEVLHTRMSATLKVWHSGTVLMLTQTLSLCVGHCADSWCIRIYIYIYIYICVCVCVCTLLHWRFYWHVSWRSSVMHLIFIQIEDSNTIIIQLQLAVLSQPACCTIVIPQLLARDSKLQYRHNLVGFTTVTNPVLVPRSWRSRAMPLSTLWATSGPATGTLYLFYNSYPSWFLAVYAMSIFMCLTIIWFKNSANSYSVSIPMCKAVVYSLWRQDLMTFCATHGEDIQSLCLINVYYIPTYALISSVNLHEITLTCFSVNTPSSGSLQLCSLKLWIIKMIKYNIVMCCYAQYEHKSSHFCATYCHIYCSNIFYLR